MTVRTPAVQTSASALLIAHLSDTEGVVLAGGPGQPAFLHLSPRTGVTGFDVLEHSDPATAPAALEALGRRLESVELLLHGLEDVRVRGFLVCPSLPRALLGSDPKARSMIASDELGD